MRISDWSSDVCSSDLLPPALQDHHLDESAAVPEAAPPAGGAAADPLGVAGCRQRRPPRRLRQRLAVQPRVQPPVRRSADARRPPPARAAVRAGAGVVVEITTTAGPTPPRLRRAFPCDPARNRDA